MTDRSATKQIVKLLRQTFFEKHNLPTAIRFSNYDVAYYVTRTILKSKKDASKEEIHSIIKKIPFICDEIRDTDLDTMMEVHNLGSKSHLTTEDLRKMHQEEYLSNIEKQFVDNATAKANALLEDERKKLAEMKETVEKEKESLDALKSELDSIPPEIDVGSLVNDEENIHEDTTPVTWWKEFYLEGDPFTNNQGLIGIPKDKYDDVVVQTPFVKSYITKIENSPEELLGKTIVVLGAFGSGKTTLFQLIAHRAGRAGIFPIQTFINPDQNITKLTHQLISQVTTGISEAFQQRAPTDILYSVPLGDETGQCIQAMTLAAKSTTKGFILFIDGLHKPERYQKYSLEFLQYLQNFQERIANSGILCGMLVAGSLGWETELHSNPSLSGSFYKIEKIPTLAEESAVEAVIRRIHSFVPAGKPQPSIVKERLREAFRILSKRLLIPPTFRDYLDHVRDRFVARQYAELGVSIALHIETAEYVKREIERSSLAEAYHKLCDNRTYNTSFRTAVKSILLELYKRRGIPESDRLFQNNKGPFYVLRNDNLIVPRYSADHSALVWHISPTMTIFLQNLYDKSKISPLDAIDALFTDPAKSLPQETETIYGYVKKLMPTMVASWRSSWPEIATSIENALSCVSQIDKTCESMEGLSNPKILDDLRVSLRSLIQATMFAAGDKEAFRHFNFEKFSKSWYAPDDIDTISSILERTKPLPHDMSQSFGVLHQHARVLGDLCRLLSDLIKGESVSRLNGRSITEEEAIKLHDARVMFLSQEYPETVDKISKLIELKIRDTIYVMLRCAYGPKALSFLPEDIRDNIKKSAPRGHPRAKRLPDDNFLYNVSRSEYSKIIFYSQNKKMIFNNSLTDDELKKIKDSLELLFSLDDREAHNDRPSYFRDHSTEIADVLRMAPQLCEMLNRTVTRILKDSRFSLKQINSDKLEFSFGPSNESYSTHYIDAPQVEASMFELLELIDCSSLTLPPLESLINRSYTTPENTIGLLHASIDQGLITAEQHADNFGFDISLTEAGKKKLKALREIRS